MPQARRNRDHEKWRDAFFNLTERTDRFLTSITASSHLSVAGTGVIVDVVVDVLVVMVGRGVVVVVVVEVVVGGGTVGTVRVSDGIIGFLHGWIRWIIDIFGRSLMYGTWNSFEPFSCKNGRNYLYSASLTCTDWGVFSSNWFLHKDQNRIGRRGRYCRLRGQGDRGRWDSSEPLVDYLWMMQYLGVRGCVFSLEDCEGRREGRRSRCLMWRRKEDRKDWLTKRKRVYRPVSILSQEMEQQGGRNMSGWWEGGRGGGIMCHGECSELCWGGCDKGWCLRRMDINEVILY